MAGLASSAFVLIVASAFALFCAVGALIPVLPRYVDGPLSGGGVDVGVVVGAFFVATLLARPLAGRLSDERGRRVVMVGGAAVVAGAVAAFPLAPGVAALAGLRFVQGAGEAAFYVAAATAVTDLVPAHRRGQAVSYFSGALYGGIALGPLAGEAVLGPGHYGRVWVLAAALAAAGALLALGLREGPRPVRTGARPRLVHPAGLMPGSAFGLGPSSAPGRHRPGCGSVRSCSPPATPSCSPLSSRWLWPPHRKANGPRWWAPWWPSSTSGRAPAR